MNLNIVFITVPYGDFSIFKHALLCIIVNYIVIRTKATVLSIVVNEYTYIKTKVSEWWSRRGGGGWNLCNLVKKEPNPTIMSRI